MIHLTLIMGQSVEWISSSGMIADLDIVVLYYDERVSDPDLIFII